MRCVSMRPDEARFFSGAAEVVRGISLQRLHFEL
jgi:hypothetical protein